MSVTVSAPGKLMLMGEHAVVYDRPCLVAAIDKRIKVTIENDKEIGLKLDLLDLGLRGYKAPLAVLKEAKILKRAQFVQRAVANFFQKYKIKAGIKLTTSSAIPKNVGFGSSAAVVVSTIKALSLFFQKNLSQKEIFDLSYQSVLDVQKIASGFDVAASLYGGVIYFDKRGKIIESLPIDNFPFVVGYSKIKADTVEMLNLVKEKIKSYPKLIEEIFDKIADLVLAGKEALLRKNWKKLGVFMNSNQDCLAELGVSNYRLDKMIAKTRKKGAYGAKLSGAGGGDCVIVLPDPKKRKSIEGAIWKVGGEVIDVGLENEGVRREI